MKIRLVSLALAMFTGFTLIMILAAAAPTSKVFQLKKLVYDIEGSTLTFEFKGVGMIGGEIAVLVVKSGDGEAYTYYVSLNSREIYNIYPDGTVSPTGRTSILWFVERPEDGEILSILEGYGRVEESEDERLVISDYRGAKEVYVPIGGLYVLSRLEMGGGAVELVQYQLSEDRPSLDWLTVVLVIIAASWTLTSTEIMARIRETGAT